MNEPSNTQSSESGIVASSLTAALLAAIVYLALHFEKAPANAVPSEFSLERAIQHIQQIANEPHATGTIQNEVVADYILNELKRLGAESQIQEATYVDGRNGSYAVGTVRNVLARIPGTAPGKAVLLIAHYDSPITSPGAGDNAASVAVLLETARVVRSGAPLKNDMVFLFTDSEESGQWGAKLFWRNHPWAKGTAVAVNFESRGASGPSLLFETGSGEGWLVRRFSEAAPYPRSSSIMPALYNILPYRTDITIFKQPGIPVMNFAFVDDWTMYHSMLDRVESLNVHSVQHHGSNALAMATDLGNADLGRLEQGKAVYFNVTGSLMIVYSRFWAGILTLLLTVLFVVVVLRARSRNMVTGKRFATGFIALPVATGVAALVTVGLMIILPKLTESKSWAVAYHMDLYVAGVAAITACLASLCYAWFATRIGMENLWLAALLWFLLLAVISLIYVPGASYVFAWPLLCGLFLAMFAQTKIYFRLRPLARVIVLCIMAFLPLVLLLPSIWLLYLGLTTPGVFFVALSIPLVMALLIPHLQVMAAPRAWLVPAGLGGLAIVLMGIASFRVAMDNSHPRPNHVFYIADMDKQAAVWASADGHVDQWTSQFFPAVSERKTLQENIPAWADSRFIREGRFLTSQAPLLPVKSANVSLVKDLNNGALRTITVSVQSPSRAPLISVRLRAGGPILSAVFSSVTAIGSTGLPNKPAQQLGLFDEATSQQKELILTYTGLPAEGTQITIETDGTPLTEAQVVEYSYCLPSLADTGIRERPASVIQNRFPGDATIVVRSFAYTDARQAVTTTPAQNRVPETSGLTLRPTSGEPTRR
jgi:Peptidase family M28